MAILYRISTTHNVYPNLTVYEKYYDTDTNTVIGFRVNANEGYVFKDTSETNYELDTETGIEREVTHYYRLAYLTRNFNFANFSFVAIPESEVDHETA